MRLIDADALDIGGYREDFPVCECDVGWNAAVRAVEGYVDAAPTIDAVPVVLCAECKHGCKSVQESVVFCHRDGRKGYEMVFKPSDFCSYGERRSDDYREKLIALAKEGDCGSLTYGECSRCEYGCKGDCSYQFLADHLLANGVTFATDNHVGGKWIPVTERLPGTEKVLITDGEIVMRGYRRPDGVWKYDIEPHKKWERLSSFPVTHWMPLPEPPKEGE